MNKGKVFEQDLKKSCQAQGVFILRLNDTSLSWQKEKTARFTPESPFDFIAFKDGILLCIECKSTKGTSFSIQRTSEDKQKMIKYHQIKTLQQSETYAGVKSGFLFNFRDDTGETESITYWLPINNFIQFMGSTEKKSINEKDIVNFGGYCIKQTVKRVRVQYDINDLFDQIKGDKKG